MSDILLPRRQLIARAGGLIAAAGTLPLLSGCDAINDAPAVRKILAMGEEMNRASQRALIERGALAREFTRADLSPYFRPNGTRLPAGADYSAHAASGFADWRVRVSGLVARPLSLSMADIRSMPQRTQITRHDCVEGWSAIGQWTGVQLSRILAAARVKDSAGYIVFRCADRLGDALYYESCDMVDARHPQCGSEVSGRVLFLPGTIGSSSASAVLLELVRNGRAPAAIVMHKVDAILLLGLIVAREMGWPPLPAMRLDSSFFAGFRGRDVTVASDGSVTTSP